MPCRIFVKRIKIFAYCNDNPFAGYYLSYFWHHYRAGLKFADVGFVYRDTEEFVQKIRYYLEHDKERAQIAEAGYKRLMQDGHEVEDRAAFIIEIYKQLHYDFVE